jgi:hypothetical protein
MLVTLKEKVVVSLDLSAIHSMIPIKPEDRYKTSYWLNDLSYEFNVLVKSINPSHPVLCICINIQYVLYQYQTLTMPL